MPHIESWVPVAPGSDFPIYNLPYGAFSKDGKPPRLGIAIGQKIVDLYALAATGVLDDICERSFLRVSTLNSFLTLPRSTWKALRLRIAALLCTDQAADDRLRKMNVDEILVKQSDVEMHVPVEIGDYVDFYSSLEHATNLGKIFRPNAEPLMPNWRHIPIGYHGRSGTIVIDGTPVKRPIGQRKPPNLDLPTFGPSTKLDIELEIGFITGAGNKLGEPIPIERARDHIFGLVLVNDWSARDIQAWEYQPLGPFLGKSFATTISPWIVTLDALDPFRVKGPEQSPPPLPYLRTTEPWGFDINLEVVLQTQKMRSLHQPGETVSSTNFKRMYWNMAQQLAHATVNGAIARPGDLFASGTISGSEPHTEGSFIELTVNGQNPIDVGSEKRTFLEDGDEVTLKGYCESGEFHIGFGQCSGRITPAG